eukprot:Clim_evm56s210 gene=Clim_evmTU56s210
MLRVTRLAAVAQRGAWRMSSRPVNDTFSRAVVSSKTVPLFHTRSSMRWYATENKEAEEKAKVEEGSEKEMEGADAETAGVEEADAYTEELEKLKKEKDDILDKYKRALAEVENTRQRGRRDVENAKLFAIQKFAKDLIGVADVLQMAIDAVPQEALQKLESDSPFRHLYDGVVMTEKEFQKTCGGHGLVKVHPMGDKFDPNLHEAMFEVDDPAKEPGTVGFVQRTGYVLNDRTVRAAQVGVIKQRK